MYLLIDQAIRNIIVLGFAGTCLLSYGQGPDIEGTVIGKGYLYDGWFDVGTFCQCSGQTSALANPAGWSLSPSVGISIGWLTATIGYNPEEPAPVHIYCKSGPCDRKRPYFGRMKEVTRLHFSAPRLTSCQTGGTYVICRTEFDVLASNETIFADGEVTWATCGYKPSQLPCQRAPCTEYLHDKNGAEEGKDLDPCPHVGKDKAGRTKLCPYPYWTEKPKLSTNIPVPECTEPFHGTAPTCCD